tara:strand:+ start:5664 stop:5948 length:285 start_codon:yes stop_codon:yes gene_type:complete
MNIETAKVNVVTVVSIVMASFSLYFFISALIQAALVEAKTFALDLDIERDQGVIAMYRFQITNEIAKPDAPARIETLEAQVARRLQEKAELRSN